MAMFEVVKGWNDDREKGGKEKGKEKEKGRRKKEKGRRKEGLFKTVFLHIHTNIHRLLQVGLLAHSNSPIVICLFYVLNIYFMMYVCFIKPQSK